MGLASAERVDLLQVLRLVDSEPNLCAGEYVTWICDQFGCGERTAKDALSILRSAGYIDSGLDAHDGRVRRYRVSDLGAIVLPDAWGPALVRLARRLFSTCRSHSNRADDPSIQRESALTRLRHAEQYLLAGPRPEIASRFPDLDDLLPLGRRPPSTRPAPPLLIVEPRCKVCRSPHRAEIDRRIAAGQSQADVRRSINSLIGSDHFSAHNISRHVRNHFHEAADPSLRLLLEQRLAAQDEARQNLIQQLSEIIEQGRQALQAGTTTATPADLIKAVGLLDPRESQRGTDLIDEISVFGAFVDVVREVTGEEQFEQIREGYLERSQSGADDRAYARRRRLVQSDNNNGSQATG